MQRRIQKPHFPRALNPALVIVSALLLSGCLRAPTHETLPTWTVVSLPDTAAGRQFDAHLKVFNAGDAVGAVKRHIKSIMGKLHAQSRLEAIARSRDLHLV